MQGILPYYYNKVSLSVPGPSATPMRPGAGYVEANLTGGVGVLNSHLNRRRIVDRCACLFMVNFTGLYLYTAVIILNASIEYGRFTASRTIDTTINLIMNPERHASTAGTYNTMADTDECRQAKYTVKTIKSAHFTICQKPWTCYKSSINPLCKFDVLQNL